MIKILPKQELNWKSESYMQKELKERISNWKEGMSKDGQILKGEGNFIYKGIAYSIKVLRYYNHTDKFVPMGNRISDCHAVVEFPEETRSIVDFIKQIDEFSDFLWHDTLHSFNDNQTIEQQIELCHEWAKKDIDKLPDIINKAKLKIKKLQEIIDKLEFIAKAINRTTS